MKLALFFQFLSILSILVSTNPTSAQCLDDQKSSLLTLFGSAHPPSWTPNTDCCIYWEGITCDGSTGHVTGLGLPNHGIMASINSTSLLSLSSLRNLDLSNNDFYDSSIPISISALSNLTHLNLSSSGFTGYVPVEISRIKSLESLDLSFTDFEIHYYYSLRFRHPDFEYVVGNLSGLRELYLDGVDISSRAPESLAGLANLRSLHLSMCNLTGAFPVDIFQMRNLETLDLSYNWHLTGSLPEFPQESRLQILSLSGTNFSGGLPSSFGNLRHLQRLVLRGCNFSGTIPLSLGGISQLLHLDISYNSFSGEIQSLVNLKQLVHLDLSWNSFSGEILSLENLTKLVLFDLSSNRFSGKIPSLENLTKLVHLDLSSNRFSGIVDLSMFQNFRSLSSLDLSNINLSINASRGNNTSFPQISRLILSFCNLREFPEFLRNQSHLHFLDLSNNQIDGEIPSWIWKMGHGSMDHLNLSHNMLYGLEPHAVDSSYSNLGGVLDLHSNKLQGPISIPLPYIRFLDYSHNNLTSVIPTNISLYLNSTTFFSLSNNNISGEIPPSICAAKDLWVLDLSLNNLSGSIPTCLGQLNNLFVLNLGKNNFRGVIPHSFQHGCSLRTLKLNGNLLEGSLPEPLANCTGLEVLNIGSNRINDSFPSWLGSLKQLRVLILRANKFYCPIRRLEHQNAFSQLQIIDVSFNGFIGNLSAECFRNLKAMMDGGVGRPSLGLKFWDLNPQYLQDSVVITLKRLEMEYLNILTILTSIDLSSNRFHGSIPEEIGNLKFLYALNMSHNEFIGPIPSSFGNLLQLESLDLSTNQLSGEIPTELTALTFLSVLDLSQNRFSGKIPQRQQFLTFGNDSFEGNPGLCGPPLSMQCEEPHEPEAPGEPTSANSPSRNHFDWRYMCMGLGFGFGNWIVMGPLLFWPRGRRWYYKHVDKILAMEIVWWDICGMRMTILKQRAYDRVRHTLLGR